MTIPERELLAALPRLRRYARSLSRDAAEAEDLLQDSLARALDRQHTWRGENLPGWLMTVMTNLYRNRNRGPAAAEPGSPRPSAFRRLTSPPTRWPAAGWPPRSTPSLRRAAPS